MRSRAVSAFVPIALAIATSVAALAAPDGREFAERIDVVEVEVPIEVRDRAGDPVRGLTAADFRILDEGRAREIHRFEVIDLVQQIEIGPTAEAVVAPAASDAQVSRPRHILLLFDLTFSSPIAVGKARLAARQVALEALHPTDLVAVAAYSVEHGARMLVTFTPDRAQVARAIDSLSFDRSSAYRAIDPLRFLVPIAPSAPSSSLGGGDGGAGSVGEQLEQIEGETTEILAEMAERESRRYETSRVTSWARGLAELGRFLATVGGRKQVLLFSEGFDSRLLLGRSELGGEDAFEESANSSAGEIWRVDSDLRYGNTPLMNETARMIEELRRADCVVHSVDIGGLRAAGEGRRFGRSQGEDGLFFLANESGGQLFRETNDLAGQMRTMLDRTSSSYLLTFQAVDVPADGAWRKLRVEMVDRRGLKVTHRSGWYAPRPFQELHPFERDLLAADTIATATTRNEIPLALLAMPFRAGSAVAYVPVIIEIDGPALVRGLDRPARIDLYAYATTRTGEFRAFFHRDLRIDPGTAAPILARGGLKYYGHFELAPDDYVVRVLVREGESGRVGSAMVPLKVPAPEANAASLLPPLFLDAPGRWMMLRERNEAESDGTMIYPFVMGGEPFVPQAGPRFRAGDRPQLALFGYNLGSAELGVEAIWIGATGDRAFEVVAAARPSGADDVRHWLVEIDLAGLAPGEHRFRLFVVERESGRRLAESEAELVIDG